MSLYCVFYLLEEGGVGKEFGDYKGGEADHR